MQVTTRSLHRRAERAGARPRHRVTETTARRRGAGASSASGSSSKPSRIRSPAAFRSPRRSTGEQRCHALRRARGRPRSPGSVTILHRVDREDIERRDFPVGRRGYDQAAVDAHLRRVADEIDALRANPGSRPAPTPLSAGTSEQVRAILEAAETRRRRAARRGRPRGGRARRARRGGRRRRCSRKLDELESELEHAAGRRCAAAASGSNDGLARLQAAGQRAAAGRPEPAAPEPEARPPEPEPDARARARRRRRSLRSRNGDEAGARLIALNMALSGTPREETAALPGRALRPRRRRGAARRRLRAGRPVSAASSPQLAPAAGRDRRPRQSIAGAAVLGPEHDDAAGRRRRAARDSARDARRASSTRARPTPSSAGCSTRSSRGPPSRTRTPTTPG